MNALKGRLPHARGGRADYGEGELNPNKSSLKEAREALEVYLMDMPGFAGISHSEKEEIITVFVMTEKDRSLVPTSFREFPVRVETSGGFEATSAK